MENHNQVIQIQDSSSSNTTTASSNSPNFHVILKNVVCSPAVLLILSLATSAVNIFIYTSIIFQWLAFFLLVSSICVFSSFTVTPLIFFIERYFVMERNRVFYFVFALKTSLRYLFGSCSLLLSWFLLVKPDMTISALHFVTSTVATSVIGSVMWMLQIVCLKGLDCRFHDSTFFQNIQDLMSNEYVLQTLLGFLREAKDSNDSTVRAQLKWIKRATKNMLLLVCTRLRTISHDLQNSNSDLDHLVINMISLVYKNVTNNEHRDIQEADLLRIMKEKYVTGVLRLFDGATETKRISQESLKTWMVQVCNARKDLVQLLNSSNKVIVQLNRHVLVIQLFLTALVWCLLMGIKITKSLLYAAPPLFFFTLYCKIIFDGAMLAIVMHPFDIGDHCIIDNEWLVVQDIWLSNTTFLNENGITSELQNSELLTKFVGNLNRSSQLTDTFEILLSSETAHDKIADVEIKIDELIRSKPENWRADYCFNLKRVDDGKDIYNLEITHATKFRNYKEMKYRRSELVLQLKKLITDIGIMNFTIN